MKSTLKNTCQPLNKELKIRTTNHKNINYEYCIKEIIVNKIVISFYFFRTEPRIYCFVKNI